MNAALKQKLSAFPGVHVREDNGLLVVEPVTEHDLVQALTALRQSEVPVRLSLAKMARIGAFNDFALTAQVDAGVPLSELESAANRSGMTLGLFSPGAMGLSLGEFLEGPYAGLRAIPGGRLEALSMALKVVTLEALATASHASPRSAAGPDLDALYLGGERRFGVISQATVRLFPKPATSQHATFSFAAPMPLIRAVIASLQDGVPLSWAAIEKRGDRFVLSLQLHGSPESLERDLATLGHRVTDNQGRGAASLDRAGATSPHERALDWRDVRAAAEAGEALQLWRLSVDGVIAVGATAQGRPLTASRRWPGLEALDEVARRVDTFEVMRTVS